MKNWYQKLRSPSLTLYGAIVENILEPTSSEIFHVKTCIHLSATLIRSQCNQVYFHVGQYMSHKIKTNMNE